MAKIKIVKLEYNIEPHKTRVWTANVAAFSTEEAMHTVSKILKKIKMIYWI